MMFRFSNSLRLTLISSVAFSLQVISFEELPNLNTDTFHSHVQRGTTFVMFYAPWCGHCKKLMPTWTELAQKYTVDTINIAKVDCSVETKLCSEERVRGYPTLLLYNSFGGLEQQNGIRFSGARTISALTDFIKDNSNIDTASTEFELENSVYVMTKGNYLEVFKQKAAFIMFYAPWCKHCNTLKPKWEQLAAEYNKADHKTSTVIAKMDCTKYVKVCAELAIDAYPSLLYMIKGKVISNYNGPRELANLQAFLDQQHKLHSSESEGDDMDGKVPLAIEQDGEPVLDVTGATFQETVGSSTTLTFMKYYTPWCGHCKKLAPTWEQLANHYARDGAVTIAKIDCTEHTHICRAQKVDGFPTLTLYKSSKVVAVYSGDRSLPDLIKFVSRHQTKDEL